MACYLVCVKALVKLGEVISLSRLSACARNAAFAVADNAPCADKSVCNGRGNGKRRTGGVTAGVCNQLFALDFISEKFGKSVNSLLVELFVEKSTAVPLGIFLLALKAEVCAEVNESLACAYALFGKLLRKTVRKSRKDNIALFNNRVLILAHHIV